MRIYLVRHGDANPKEQDPDRHLSDRGRREVAKMAAFLKPLGLKVDAIWHSGKPRAQETAEALAGAVASGGGLSRRKGLSPDDPIEPVAEELIAGAADIMIVGHLPFLGGLASLLLTGRADAEPVDFAKCGVVCLEGGAGRPWQVKWMLVPELLG
jgi:phosphohistidine phosphatase